MRILVANDGLEHGSLSVPRLARQLALHLSTQGHETALVGAVGDRASVGEGWDEGLKTFRIYSDYPVRFRAVRGLYNRDTVPKFRDIVSRWKPDVVHFHNVHTHLSFHCLEVARRAGARVLLTAHDVMLFWSGKLECFDERTTLEDVLGGRIDYRTRWWRAAAHQRFRYLPLRNALVRRLVARHAHRVISVSDCLHEALTRNGFANLTTIHNGVPADVMDTKDANVDGFRRKFAANGRKLILAGGRLGYLKGIEHLLQAVARLDDGVRLVIAGRGTPAYEDRLRRLAESLRIDRRVTFTGWIEGEALRSAFAAADVCVNPSLCFETLSMFNLEAMAAAKPVVTTFFGGARETIVEGDSGTFVNPYRIEQLASRLSTLLDDDARAVVMGERGRRRVAERFDAATQMRRVRELYDDAS